MLRAVSLAGVLALQLWTCRGKLDRPFLDTRLHYDHDNADFSFKARSGNRNPDLRSQFGVTNNEYSRWGAPTGRRTYYTDHPFLVKALFQQFTRIAGTGERASRAFSLAVAFLLAAGFHTIVLRTTGSFAAALAGTTTLVSLPVFAVYQTAIKFELDGMFASVWLFVALLAYLKSGSNPALARLGCLTGLAILVHWTAILFVAAIGLFLLAVSWHGDRRPRRAFLVMLSAGILGAALLLGLMTYVQGNWSVAWQALTRSFAARSASIPADEWWQRQWSYARSNFGRTLPWVELGLVLFLAGTFLRSRIAGSEFAKPPSRSTPDSYELALFFFSTLAVAGVWLKAFRQGSFIHIYWQMWFCLPFAALVAASIASLRKGMSLALGIAACGALLISLTSDSTAAYARVLEDQLGTPPDIAFLASLREDRFPRWMFVPLTDTPLNQWFQGPLFEYYTDRPVVVATRAADVRAGDKVLVLRYKERDEVAARLAAWSGLRLANEKCGPRLCAYDALEP